MPTIRTNHYLGLIVAVTASSSFATEAEDAIAACARVASIGDRIICLEDALRRFSADAQPAPLPQARPEADDEVLVASDSAGPPAARTVAVTAAVAPETGPPALSAVTAEPAPAVVESTPQQKVPAEDTSAEAVELGVEQLAARNDEDKEQVRISARIVAHELVGTGRLRLTLDNGQVWQQTGDDDDRIARRLRGKDELTVEMWQSRSGGYRMYVTDIDRTLRVRRLQ